jgi:hypothetical protein
MILSQYMKGISSRALNLEGINQYLGKGQVGSLCFPTREKLALAWWFYCSRSVGNQRVQGSLMTPELRVAPCMMLIIPDL